MRLSRREERTTDLRSEREFAVVDVETTGLFPGGHDRVVEIGIVLCDRFGEREGEYATLVNPGRDLGPTCVHGIRGRDVRDAPTFAEIVGDVSCRLSGRVLVAHNARFDRAFLASEFAHAGYALPDAPWLCTMELGARATGVRRLSACCDALAIAVVPSHCARDDASAAALILASCLKRDETKAAVELALAGAQVPAPGVWPPIPPCGRCASRSEGRPPQRESYISTLLDRLAPTGFSRDGASVAYLELLDRALEDHLLTSGEAQALAALASSWGIGRDACAALHEQYLSALVAAARRDGIVTQTERADLDDVASLLAIEPSALDRMLHASCVDTPKPALPEHQTNSLIGMSVCFTGQLACTIHGEPITRDLAESLAAERGLIVKQGVSRKLDLLVVADPDSLSGKARKARECGTRIIVESSFWRSLEVKVD